MLVVMLELNNEGMVKIFVCVEIGKWKWEDDDGGGGDMCVFVCKLFEVENEVRRVTVWDAFWKLRWQCFFPITIQNW